MYDEVRFQNRCTGYFLGHGEGVRGWGGFSSVAISSEVTLARSSAMGINLMRHVDLMSPIAIHG